ncbi:MAG TPA: hypothetical protein VGJ54_00220, partial [Streptosporangiaceae bacterium]
MTARHSPRRLALADDDIIDLIAVGIAAHGARTVALTPAEWQLAAARGGTPYLISKRLHINGTTALTPRRTMSGCAVTTRRTQATADAMRIPG